MSETFPEARPPKPLLEVIDVFKTFRLPRDSLFGRRPLLRAIAGVNFNVFPSRSFGIVGESGSGKSTLARAAIALERPTSGEIRVLGADLNRLPRAELRAMRAHMQMIFQDPYGSLDPRQSVARIVAEPLSCLPGAPRAERLARVAQSLEAVGLAAGDMGKYPHEFSGGQRQRIAIARALITRPRLVVADEPVSALDVSVQAQILNLMMDLQRDLGVTYLFISHDLAVVERVCDHLAVMYRGKFVETGRIENIMRAPAHPYSRALIDAAPRLGFERRAAPPPPPRISGPDTGCVYAARCPRAEALCLKEAPTLRAHGEARLVACHFPL